MQSQKLNLSQACWAAYLSSFWFYILHTPGNFNPVDTASWCPGYEKGRAALPLMTLLKHALLKGGISFGALPVSVSSLDGEFYFPAAGA